MMFGLFKRKQPSVMDGLIKAFGSGPKSADLDVSVHMAYTLLEHRVDAHVVSDTAQRLFEGPIPYSTHDLAVATALRFLKDPQLQDKLKDVQWDVRRRVGQWQKEGKVDALLADSFEAVLTARYDTSRAS